jgi:hypothetical protein
VLAAQIDNLRKRMPKKALKKLDAEAQLAAEQELDGLGGGDRGRKNKSSCVIS